MPHKLYIKQKVFTMPSRDKYTVKDTNENDVYTIKNKLISLHSSVEVFDLQGNLVAKVSKEHLTLRPTYKISVRGEEYATIRKKLSLGRDKYEIDLKGETLKLNGSLFDHNFSLSRNGQTIGHVSKARISWGDSYEITLEDGSQDLELLAVGIVLTIDQISFQD